MDLMQNQTVTRTRPHIAFLLLLALGITSLFYWMVKGFILTIVMAAVFSAIAHPFYLRLTDLLRGRKAMASGITVLLSLFTIIIPLVLFLGILVGQAIEISQSAEDWMSSQVENTEALQKKLQEDPALKRLLPYQDEILEKTGQLASKAGAFVAGGIAAGAKGTAEFFLMLFVMLYGMFYFLIYGSEHLNGVLRFTPLTESEKSRLLGTFASVGRATLKGTVIIGILQGGLAGLSFWVAGIDGVVFWSALMAVLSILPGIGTAMVWIPAVIYLILNGQIGAAVGVGLWCAIVVGSVDNFLRPLLIGKDTQMPDLLVLLTTLGGLAAFGAVGIVVGPIVGAMYLTVWKLWGSAMDDARGGDAATAEPNQSEG